MDRARLREAIGRVIREEIEPGCYFDSHSVLWFLKKENPTEYKDFVQELSDRDYSANGLIGITIREFENDLVQKQEDVESWSKNTRGNFSKCALWRRIG